MHDGELSKSFNIVTNLSYMYTVLKCNFIWYLIICLWAQVPSMGEENFVCTFYRIICLGLTFDPVYFPVYMYFPETAWHLFHKNN